MKFMTGVGVANDYTLAVFYTFYKLTRVLKS